MSEWVKNKLELENIPQRTPEWYKARQGRLTASDVPAVIGMNKYCSPKQLISRKLDPGGFTGNAATRWGTHYEEEAIALYMQKTGEVVHECGLFIHPAPALQWLGGSPDGLTNSKKAIEVKCPYYKDILESVPECYEGQVRLVQEILDVQETDFIQYIPGTVWRPAQMKIITVQRDPAWFSQHLPTMRQWHLDMLSAKTKHESGPANPKPKRRKQIKRTTPYMIRDDISCGA